MGGCLSAHENLLDFYLNVSIKRKMVEGAKQVVKICLYHLFSLKKMLNVDLYLIFGCDGDSSFNRFILQSRQLPQGQPEV